MTVLREAVADLDQIHQGRGASPRGLTVEEIRERIVFDLGACPACDDDELEEYLSALLDWIDQRLEAKTERIGARQPASGKAMDEGDEEELCKCGRSDQKWKIPASLCRYCHSNEGAGDPTGESNGEI